MAEPPLPSLDKGVVHALVEDGLKLLLLVLVAGHEVCLHGLVFLCLYLFEALRHDLVYGRLVSHWEIEVVPKARGSLQPGLRCIKFR